MDVVLTDIDFENMDGLQLTRRLKEERPTRAVLIVTAYEHYMENARNAGADGYVLQARVDGQLIEAIDVAVSGESYFRQP